MIMNTQGLGKSQLYKRSSNTLSTSIGYGYDLNGLQTYLFDFAYNYKIYDFGLHAVVNEGQYGVGNVFMGTFSGKWKYSFGVGNLTTHTNAHLGSYYFSSYYSVKYLPLSFMYIDFEHHILFETNAPIYHRLFTAVGFTFPFSFW